LLDTFNKGNFVMHLSHYDKLFLNSPFRNTTQLIGMMIFIFVQNALLQHCYNTHALFKRECAIYFGYVITYGMAPLFKLGHLNINIKIHSCLISTFRIFPHKSRH
jgi:hypothetical protein